MNARAVVTAYWRQFPNGSPEPMRRPVHAGQEPEVRINHVNPLAAIPVA